MAVPRSLMGKFEKKVADTRPEPNRRLTIFDEDTVGLCLRVSPKGRKTFMIVARGPDGKQVWREVAKDGAMPLAKVREKAREGVQRVKAGLDPFPAAPAPAKAETFEDVATRFISAHVHKVGRKNAQGEALAPLRSAAAIERQLQKIVGPEWNHRPFAEIDSTDLLALQDKIAAKTAGRDGNLGGPVMADRVLATLSTLFSQQRGRIKGWVPPTIGRLTKGSETARSRVLFDVNRDDKELVEAGTELRLLWQAAELSGAFGALVQLLVLTAQRRSKVAAMKWADIDLDRGVWTIPTERREKGNAERLKLPAMALDIIKAQTPIEGNPHVFPGRGDAHLTGYSPLKAALDSKIAAANGGEPLKPWVLHDLRRTSRTLMSRAGVEPHVSERLLGHSLGAMEKVYQHYKWSEPKAKGLAKLARLVETIVHPPEGNVVKLRGRA